MVVLGGEFLVLLQAPGLGMPFEFHSFVDGKSWDTYAGETEVIGAIVVSGFGSRVGTNGKPEVFCGCLHDVIEGSALRAGDFNFFGRTQGFHVVIIQVEGDLAGGNGRMLAKIFRTEKPLLLGGDRGKHYGTTGPLGGSTVSARELEQYCAAGCIVLCAVVDVVTGHVGANAKVIVVRGVHDSLAAEPGIRATQHADDVIPFKWSNLADHVCAQLDGQVHGLEVTRADIR